MLFFYHSEQKPENSSFYKGKLFEELLKSFLERLGYDVDIREKHNSLEYDLVGRNRLNGEPLIGEAKAHAQTISAKDFTSFVGKLIPHQAKSPNLIGLYLSTSALTAEAADYFREIEQSPVAPKVITGDQLLSRISQELNLPKPEHVSVVVSELGVHPLSVHYLMTDRGPFLMQISADPQGATPAWFSLVRRDGVLVNDAIFLAAVGASLPELRELAPLSAHVSGDIAGQRTAIVSGLILGDEWADYRLPASPSHFVGRTAIIERLSRLIEDGLETGVIQVKSRSGVGKSSLMAYVSNSLSQRDNTHVRLYDVRNLKSVIDVFAVIQDFAGSKRAITDFGSVEYELANLPSAGRSILIFDQFESTFYNPELFSLYESIALAAVKHRPLLTLILARKNDLITTYDNSRISLDRLNQISTSIVLEDFTAPEAVELIDKISKHSERKISSEIKTYVLEFAQGFPWLLKRTMAHILRLLERGVPLSDLVPAALKLDDLFNEELEELDEIERDYIMRLAPRLPATYQELERAFDEDENLAKILERLTYYRLIRLSGSTYDTYNDVFKEFLVYKKLPDVKWSFLYKLGPSSVMKTFTQLSEFDFFTTDELGGKLGMARGTAFNLIRELRNQALIDRHDQQWVIPESVIDAFGRGRLGEYIRQRVARNGLVIDLLSTIQTTGSVDLEFLPGFLEERFPFIQATNKTWKNYAKNLERWILAVRLADLRNGALFMPASDRATIAKELGNLKQKFRLRTTPTAFLPSVHWSHVIETLPKILGNLPLSMKQQTAANDLRELKILVDAESLVRDIVELRALLGKILMGDVYVKFWRAVSEGQNLDLVLTELFGLHALTPGTVLWRRKLLVNWGKALSIIPDKQTRRVKTIRNLELPLFQ